MLQVIGLVLAIQTRKVKLRGLRDSKYVAAIIYISSISVVVMALVTFALDKYINIGTGILAVVILALTTIFLILIFVPKVKVFNSAQTLHVFFFLIFISTFTNTAHYPICTMISPCKPTANAQF